MDSEGFLNEGNTAMTEGQFKHWVKSGEVKQGNEVVFHHSVPINFIRKINFSDFSLAQEFYDRCPPNLKQIVCTIIQIVQTIPDERYECPAAEIVSLTPNYCFVFDDNFHYHAPEDKDKGRGYHRDMEYYRWMAMQCGLSRKEVNQLKTPEELNKKLRPIVLERFKRVARGTL